MPNRHSKPMNLKTEITRLLKRSETLSTIRFLPYTSSLPSKIVDCNVALRSAENEEVRWNLFLALLRAWLHQGSPAFGRATFGSIAAWSLTNPPRLVVGVTGKQLSLHLNTLIVAEVIGDPTLIERYSRTLRMEKLTVTLPRPDRLR